jgi:hypothetical protein
MARIPTITGHAPRPGTPGGSGGVNYKKELNSLLTNLNKEISALANRSMNGLIKSAIMIRNETEKGDVVTPVDLGNLRASWFVVTANGKIVRGGGKTHTAEGMNKGTFVGKNASRLISGHSSAIKEAQGYAEVEANKKWGPFLVMGYSAYYAGFVHEMVGAENWSRERSGPKWFQAAIFKLKDRILDTIRENARIK